MKAGEKPSKSWRRYKRLLIPIPVSHLSNSTNIGSCLSKQKQKKPKNKTTANNLFFGCFREGARTRWVTRYLNISFHKTFWMDVINQIIMGGIKFSIEQWLDDIPTESAAKRLIYWWILWLYAKTTTTKTNSKIRIELFCQSDWMKVVFNRSNAVKRQAIS